MPAQENITVSPRAPRSLIPRYFLRNWRKCLLCQLFFTKAKGPCLRLGANLQGE